MVKPLTLLTVSLSKIWHYWFQRYRIIAPNPRIKCAPEYDNHVCIVLELVWITWLTPPSMPITLMMEMTWIVWSHSFALECPVFHVHRLLGCYIFTWLATRVLNLDLEPDVRAHAKQNYWSWIDLTTNLKIPPSKMDIVFIFESWLFGEQISMQVKTTWHALDVDVQLVVSTWMHPNFSEWWHKSRV